MSSDTSLVFRLIARDEASPEISAMQERLSTASTAIGAGVAAGLGIGIAENLNTEAANAKLTAQLGIGPAEAAELSKVSAKVYMSAWGDSTATVNEAVRHVYQQIGDVSDAQGGLEGVTTKVLALAQTFDQEAGPAAAAVGQMIKTGLAKNADEALDVLTKGFQGGVDKAGDLLDTFNEYSTQFRDLGLNGQAAMGILQQGLKGGARDADIVADAMKELNIRVQSGDAAEALKKIHINGKDMAAAFAKGGPEATAALDKITDAVRGVEDPTKRYAIAQGILGTQSEDLSKALLAIDPSKAVGALGEVSGAADKMAKTVGDNPAAAVETFKRKVVHKLGEVGGVFVNFAMGNQGVMKGLAVVLLVVASGVIGVSVAQRLYATYTAIATVATNVHNSALYRCVAGYLRLMAVGLMAMVRIAAASVVSAATTAAAWAGSALASIGTWIAAVIRAGVTALAQFTLMAARAVIWAATMAAQWLIAMGPIGWITLAVIAIVALVVANWDTIKKWTLKIWNWLWGHIKSIVAKLWNIFLNWTIAGLVIKHWDKIKSGTVRAWNATMTWIKGVPGKIVSFFLNWTLYGLIIKHWGRIKSGSIQVATSLVTWVRGLPGRISRGVGSLGSLLYSKGRSVVQGLWNGISGLGGWLWGKVKSFATDTIKGAIDSALEIFSPSKVTKAQGRWIVRGLIDGLTGSAKQLKAASFKVADIVRDTLPKGRVRNRVLGVISADTKKLMSLAKRQEKVHAALKSAQKKLADLYKDRDKLAASVKDNILKGADITSMVGEDSQRGMGAMNILDGLKKKAAEALKFANLMNVLRKKGVSGALISQIAAAGVEGGMSSAQALATASDKQIKDINKQQKILTNAAGKAGDAAGHAMYDSGIKAAKGLVKGLKAQEKAIEAQMMRIAKHMAKAIKKALGIRSPSALMADEVGAFIPSGVMQGVHRKTPRLATDLRKWAVAMVRPVREGAAAPGRGATTPVLGSAQAVTTARPLQANLIVDGRTLASLLIDPLRGEIQRISGGDVQKALGRGNA